MPADTNAGNSSSAIAKFLNQLNLPTLGLILLMGGGNWFATKSTSDQQRSEIYHAIRQINDLHHALDQFEDRQKESLFKTTQSLELLRNQTQTLEAQTRMLQQIQQKQ